MTIIKGKDLMDLSDEDWEHIVYKLFKYAKRKIWIVDFGHLSAEDIALLAVEKLLSGERKVNIKKYGDILTQLKSVVDSIFYNENKKYKKIADKKEKNKEIEDLPEFSTDQELTSEQRNEYSKEKLQLLEEYSEQDEDILFLIEAIKDSYYSPKEIQEILGWDQNKFNAVKKRIRRRYNKDKGE